jgi:class 3 adenylate cyclase
MMHQVDIPRTQYARTPVGEYVAYQVVGEGPHDIVMPSVFGPIEIMWDEPFYAHALQRLARLGRLITVDFRGVGASDPVPLGALPTFEQWMDDIRVVMDAVGSQSANLVLTSLYGAMLLFAATYPERINALVLYDCYPRFTQGDDYPYGMAAEFYEEWLEAALAMWGTGASARMDVPSRNGDKVFRQWRARAERLSASPRAVTTYWRQVQGQLDMRAVLPTIRVPTLVVHHEDRLGYPLDHGRYLADQIPQARLVVVPGADDAWFTESADDLIDVIEEFITGARPVREPDRVLATVLFTDIVGSTSHAAAVGDRRWREMLDRYNTVVRGELERFRGRQIKGTGDGTLATFDGPARAIRCACAIREATKGLGLELRSGLHTGEIELHGDDVAGIAVHIAARVCALAEAGEVIVSRTVTDLVAGSGIAFQDRGEQELKGVPGAWRLCAVDG